MALRQRGPDSRVDIMRDLGQSPRIALLRAGGLGDFISTTAALRAVRAALPQASLTLITSPNVAPLARRYDAIDHIVVAPAYPGVVKGTPDDAATSAFFKSMEREHFDLALQWHGGGTHSNRFVQRLGARVTAGFKGEDAPPLDHWIPYDVRQHEVLRYLDLLRLLGIESSDVRTYLPVIPADHEELSALRGLVDQKALDQGMCMGIHASAGAPSRRWAPERFALVADRLLEEFGFQAVLVTAGPGQESDSAAVVANMAARNRAVDLGGKITLGGLVALISQLGFFLGNDSGPSHMAVALGTPSVVVFGSAHPINWAPLERTYHRAVAYWAAPCRWMINDGCPDTAHVPCIQGVQPEEVLAEARQLLRMLGMKPPRPKRRPRGTHTA